MIRASKFLSFRTLVAFASDQKPPKKEFIFMKPKSQKIINNQDEQSEPQEEQFQQSNNKGLRQSKPLKTQTRILFSQQPSKQKQNFDQDEGKDQDQDYDKDINQNKDQPSQSDKKKQQYKKSPITLGKFNQFLKSNQEQSEKEKLVDIKKQFEEAQKQQDSPKKYQTLISYSVQLLQNPVPYFEQYMQNSNNKFHKLIFEAILKAQVDNFTLDINQRYLFIKNLIHQHEQDLNKLDQSIFHSVYELIFNIRALPYEKAQELVDFHKLLDNQNIKLSLFDLQYFSYIFDQYQQYPKNFDRCLQAFNLYLKSVSENLKNKNQTQQLENVPISEIFSTAVDLIQQNPDNFEVLKSIIQSLSESNQQIDPYMNDQLFSKVLETLLKNEKQFNHLMLFTSMLRKKQFNSFAYNGLQNFIIEDLEGLTQSVQNLHGKMKYPTSNLNLIIIGQLASITEQWEIVAEIFEKYETLKNDKNIAEEIYLIAQNMILAQKANGQMHEAISLMQSEMKEKGVENVNQIENKINSLKGLIKDGNYKAAHKIFNDQIIHEIIIEFQREKIRRLLFKYVQNRDLGTEWTENYHEFIYAKRIQNAMEFVSQLPEDFLMNLYREDDTDNYLYETLTDNSNPHQYWEIEKYYELFKEMRQLIFAGEFPYKEIVHPRTQLLKDYKYVFDNYEYFVSRDKERRKNIGLKERFYQIKSKLKRVAFHRKTDQQIMDEILQVYSQEELQQGLLKKDILNYPELEQVAKIRNFFLDFKQMEDEYQVEELKISLTKPKKQKKKKEQSESSEKQDIEQISDSELNNINKGKSNIQMEQFIRKNYMPNLKDEDVIDPKTQQDEGFSQYTKKNDYSPFAPTNYLQWKEQLTINQFMEMKYRYYDVYQKNNQYIMLQGVSYEQTIWNLIGWGLHQQEPFAIRLGEQYAQLTGRKIPKELSQQIGYFYKYALRDKEIKKRWEEGYKVGGQVDQDQVYDLQDSAFVKEIDKEILKNNELRHYTKHHARALMKTEFSENRYQRYGVSQDDVLRRLRQDKYYL